MKVDYQQREDLPQHRENILKYHLPVHAAQVKEGSLKAWSVQQLYLPTGGDSRYNVKQHHWHPNFPAIYRPGGTSTSELLKKMFGVSLSDINPPSEGFKSEVYRVVQLVRPSRTTPSGAGQ